MQHRLQLPYVWQSKNSMLGLCCSLLRRAICLVDQEGRQMSLSSVTDNHITPWQHKAWCRLDTCTVCKHLTFYEQTVNNLISFPMPFKWHVAYNFCSIIFHIAWAQSGLFGSWSAVILARLNGGAIKWYRLWWAYFARGAGFGVGLATRPRPIQCCMIENHPRHQNVTQRFSDMLWTSIEC